MVRKTLLGCGIVSSVLYVVTDVLGTLRYRSYSYADQTFSELTAQGAPTRDFMVALNVINLFCVRLSIFLSIPSLPHTCLPGGRRVRHVAQQDDDDPDRYHGDRCEPAYRSHDLPGRERHPGP